MLFSGVVTRASHSVYRELVVLTGAPLRLVHTLLLRNS